MKKGFTLAEILLSIVIIGIISALVIPSLLNNIHKQQLSSKFAKVYSVLNRGVKQAESFEGYFTNWNMVSGEQVYKDYFSEIFSVIKTCSAGTADCGSSDNYKYLNGIPVSTPFPNSLFRFITADGALWAIGINKNCLRDKVYCALIRVDINGDAPPNTYGRDVYTFFMLPYTNEIRVEGHYDFPSSYDYKNGWQEASAEEINSDCSKNGGGLLCGAKLIKDGYKMNY